WRTTRPRDRRTIRRACPGDWSTPVGRGTGAGPPVRLTRRPAGGRKVSGPGAGGRRRGVAHRAAAGPDSGVRGATGAGGPVPTDPPAPNLRTASPVPRTAAGIPRCSPTPVAETGQEPGPPGGTVPCRLKP